MNLLLITSRPRGDAARRIVQAARRQGHACTVMGPGPVHVSGGAGAPRSAEDLGLGNVDAAHVRPGPGPDVMALGVAAVLERAGVPLLNGAQALAEVANPARLLLALDAAGVPVVPFRVATSGQELVPPGTRGPWFIQPLGGTVPRPDVRARSAGSLRAVSAALLSSAGPLLVRSGSGRAFRAVMVGTRAVAWLGRDGPTPRLAGPDPDMGRVVRAVMRVTGLDVAAVDLRVDGGVPGVEAVTAAPALDAAHAVAGKDVAALLVRAWVRRARGR